MVLNKLDLRCKYLFSNGMRFSYRDLIESNFRHSQLFYQGSIVSLCIWSKFVKFYKLIKWLLIANRTVIKVFIAAALSNVAGLAIRNQFSSF